MLADSFSLEFEWEQVSSSLQYSSQYSSRSEQCCSLGGVDLSSYFFVLQSLYQSFCDYTQVTNYNWYNRHFHVPQFFHFPSKVEYYYYYHQFGKLTWNYIIGSKKVLTSIFDNLTKIVYIFFGPGGDRVLFKEYGCNLQDIYMLIGRAITMTG